MSTINELSIVVGKTLEGKKFRPSDWIERICALAASYGEDRRLRYSPYLIPCQFNGELALQVRGELARSNPSVYAFVMEFAHGNHLQVHGQQVTANPEAVIDLPRVA